MGELLPVELVIVAIIVSKNIASVLILMICMKSFLLVLINSCCRDSWQAHSVTNEQNDILKVQLKFQNRWEVDILPWQF